MEALSYCQLMERCIALEAEVAELKGQQKIIIIGNSDYCSKHTGVRLMKHPYNILASEPPETAMYCPECEPNVKEWAEQQSKRWMSKAP